MVREAVKGAEPVPSAPKERDVMFTQLPKLIPYVAVSGMANDRCPAVVSMI